MLYEPPKYDRRKIAIAAAVVAGVVFIVIILFYVLRDIRQSGRPGLDLDEMSKASSEAKKRSMMNALEEANKDASPVDGTDAEARRRDMEAVLEKANSGSDSSLSSNDGTDGFDSEDSSASGGAESSDDISESDKLKDMLMELDKANNQ